MFCFVCTAKQRLMDHLMGCHGWTKPCPLMPQGSQSLVKQLASQACWDKISTEWLSTRDEKTAAETKRRAEETAKPTMKRCREDKHGQSVKWADDIEKINMVKGYVMYVKCIVGKSIWIFI